MLYMYELPQYCLQIVQLFSKWWSIQYTSQSFSETYVPFIHIIYRICKLYSLFINQVTGSLDLGDYLNARNFSVTQIWAAYDV